MRRDGDVGDGRHRHPNARSPLECRETPATCYKRSEAALAEWIQQKLPVAALHQIGAKAGEANGAVTQVVRFPAAFRDAPSAKQRDRDLAIGGALESSVERAQSAHQTCALGLGKCRWITPRVASTGCKPQTPDRFQADIKQRVDRQDRTNRLCIEIGQLMHAKRCFTADELQFGTVSRGDPIALEFQGTAGRGVEIGR